MKALLRKLTLPGSGGLTGTKTKIAVGSAIFLLLLAGGYWYNLAQMPARDIPQKLPPAPQVDADAIKPLLPRDSIQAIDDPQFVPADIAAPSMKENERVIGVIINGDARAYPIPILSVHEIINDVVGGEPIAVTWCPLCYTALVFSSKIDRDSQILTFGVSGNLLYNTLVMYDRQTESLWSQLYGASIEGPLSNETLGIFPSVHTDWKTWISQYPDSLVLSKELTCAQFDCGTYASNPRGSYYVDPYASYYIMPDEGVIDRQIPREEVAMTSKKKVLGVLVGAQARAYPYAVLSEQPLINDTINGVPVLIWFDNDTQTGVAFVRRDDDLVLTFVLSDDFPDLVLDIETRSLWQPLSGIAVAGPLKGQRLPSLVVTSAFEFGWYAYFPASETYPSNE